MLLEGPTLGDISHFISREKNFREECYICMETEQLTPMEMILRAMDIQLLTTFEQHKTSCRRENTEDTSRVSNMEV